MNLMPHLLMVHNENGSLGYITKIEQGGEMVEFHQVMDPDSFCMLPVHKLRGLDRLVTPEEEKAIQSNPLLFCRYELSAEMPEIKESWWRWAIRNVRSAIGLSVFIVLIAVMAPLVFSLAPSFFKEALWVLLILAVLIFLVWCCAGFFDNGFSKRRGRNRA